MRTKAGGILLAVLLAVGVGACGDDEEDEDSTSVTTATTIAPAQTSAPVAGLTTTSVARGVTTLQ